MTSQRLKAEVGIPGKCALGACPIGMIGPARGLLGRGGRSKPRESLPRLHPGRRRSLGLALWRRSTEGARAREPVPWGSGGSSTPLLMPRTTTVS